MNQNENQIVKLSFEFAIDLIAFVEILDENRKYVV